MMDDSVSAVEKMFSCLTIGKKAQEETPFMKNERMLLEELIASCNGKCNHIRTFSSQELNRATNNYHHEQMIFRDSSFWKTAVRLQLNDSVKMMKCLRFDKKRDRKDKIFLRNGSMLLEQMITFCNGKCSIPIKSFSEKELQKATNNFKERQLLPGLWCRYYKGFLQDRPVTIKKISNLQLSINEIVYASTDCPTVVFEYVEGKTLYDRIIDRKDGHFQPVTWNERLKIAIDLANVVVYMHTAFPRPIVHRDIKPSNVFLDGNSTAKLSDFSLCLSIPEGETYVEDGHVRGTIGFMAPETLSRCCFNEKSDVYSFGMLLLELLTGQSLFDLAGMLSGNVRSLGMNRFKELLDPFILGEAVKEHQLESVGALKWQKNLFVFIDLKLILVSFVFIDVDSVFYIIEFS
ncbi:serine/threonine-protein kinase ZRK1-like [Euphorbia lathyris]|uniref:serine/threonine-protein kinase ZRK1-like n=1 Tax=Euphorbia lathyris TaxID=212925 RepID=UPI003313DD36